MRTFMALLSTPVCDFGQPALDFSLPGVDGRQWTLADVRGPQGLLVMFLCNHCPYVKAIRARLLDDVRALQALGVGVVAINANDATDYPEDSLAGMQAVAAQHAYPFPYLHDASQDVARAYGAVCTPDFFGYDAQLGLQYRGRLDASGRDPAPDDAPRELLEAMRQVIATGHGPAQQVPSMGCSIKWRAN